MRSKFIFLILLLVSLNAFSQALKKFREGYLWGYQDAATKKTVIAAKFGYAEEFKDGLAIVAEGASSPGQAQKLRIINTKGSYITDSVYGKVINIGKGLVAVTSTATDNATSGGVEHFGNNVFGIIDKTGKLILPIEYTKISEASEGMIVVEKDGQYGVIDFTGKFVYPLQSDYVIFTFSKCGFAQIRNNSMAFSDGLMDKTFKIILDPKTSGLRFVSGFNKSCVAEFTKDNMHGLINSSGKIVVDATYPSSSGLKDDGVVFYKDNDRVGVKFDGTGKKK